MFRGGTFGGEAVWLVVEDHVGHHGSGVLVGDGHVGLAGRVRVEVRVKVS